MKGNIPNHPNYHITKEGRLFSNKSGEWVERKGQVYRGCPSFYFEGKWHRSSRLVATVYISNPYNYPIVMHKDNNRMNNHVSIIFNVVERVEVNSIGKLVNSIQCMVK